MKAIFYFMENHEKIYWIFFNAVEKITPRVIFRLLKGFSGLERAFCATLNEYRHMGIDNELIENIFEAKKDFDPEKEIDFMAKHGINICTIIDQDYPRLLKEISSPPPVIYYQGDFIDNKEIPVAIVGTRKPTAYGRQAALKLGRELSENGLSIVSGLAIGIDALAHQAAIEAGGRTIAVLGSGIDNAYPASNRRLAEEILESGGLIVSEFPLNTPPFRQNFPRRNRIISGLSLAALILEASEKSGALITARFALEQNREVFALPGPIFSERSAGPNNLIRMGARVITNTADILNDLNLENIRKVGENRAIFPDTKEEAIIIEILRDEVKHIDKIIEESKLDSSIINSTLTLMEMKGKVKNIGGLNFTLGC